MSLSGMLNLAGLCNVGHQTVMHNSCCMKEMFNEFVIDLHVCHGLLFDKRHLQSRTKPQNTKFVWEFSACLRWRNCQTIPPSRCSSWCSLSCCMSCSYTGYVSACLLVIGTVEGSGSHNCKLVLRFVCAQVQNNFLTTFGPTCVQSIIFRLGCTVRACFGFMRRIISMEDLLVWWLVRQSGVIGMWSRSWCFSSCFCSWSGNCCCWSIASCVVVGGVVGYMIAVSEVVYVSLNVSKCWLLVGVVLWVFLVWLVVGF